MQQSKFNVGDYVRTTIEPYSDVTGIVREARYEQLIDMLTREPVDAWSWGYMVEFERGFPVYTMERFLRKVKVNE